MIARNSCVLVSIHGHFQAIPKTRGPEGPEALT